MYIKPNLLQALTRVDTGINQATDRIASGKRINSALDDPIAFNRITSTKASVSETGIKLSTLDYGIGRLEARDQVLGSMQDTLMRFQELATMASSGIHRLADLAPEMASLKEALISLGNTSDASGLMFAGTASTAPFVKDPVTGVVSYAGAVTENVIDVDGVKLNGSINGTPLMAAFNAIDSVLATMAGGTPPTAAEVGSVQAAIGVLVDTRTGAAAQAAGATNIKSALTARSDRESEEVSRMEEADMTTETIRLTEGQKHYEAILKVTGMELNRRRLMDFI